MKNALILIVLLSVIGLYTWASQGWAPEASVPVSQAYKNLGPAKDFTTETISGEKISLSNFKGKTVVLNFWATWCPPCIVEFPMMLQLAKATSGNSVFLFVSVDQEREVIDRFLNKHAKSLPLDNVHIIWNPNKEIAEKLYGTFRLPETYLIDGDGIIRDKIIGADIDWSSAGMQQKIRKLATSQP